MTISSERYLFLGVGGMGMAPLAAWMATAGYSINGCDDHLQEHVRAFLVRSGVSLHDFVFPESISRYTKLVYSNAIQEEHPLLVAAREKGLYVVRRGELLAEVATGKRLIAIAGSHGKTTTSGMIAHGIRHCGMDIDYILGGFFNDLLLPASCCSGSRWLVAEIDESDGTIEKISPEITVLLNIDWDHSDFYNTHEMLYGAFADLVARTAGKVFVPANLFPRFKDMTKAEVVSFLPLETPVVASSLGEEFNRINGSAALSVLNFLASEPLCEDVFSSFGGMARRQAILHRDIQLTLIEDYAHHPMEIEALLNGLRSMDPDRRLVVVFQAHRYSRTRQFKDEFARVLRQADQLFLLPIYGAHEPEVDGGRLVDLSRSFIPDTPMVLSMDMEGLYRLANSLEEIPTTLVFVGAGNIDQFASVFTSLIRFGFQIDEAWPSFMAGRISKECILKKDEPLANKTTMRIGGHARFYSEPANLTDLLSLLCGAKLFGLRIFCLGRGSNLLVPDDGFDGLVIRFNAGIWRCIEFLGEGRIWVAAGVRLKEICGFAAKHNLSGFEFLEGIPGSVGGALRMNAGAMNSWMFDIVERVQFIDSEGRMQDLPKEAFHFGYREVEEISQGVALGAVLKSTSSESEQTIRERIQAFSTTRKSSQPREPSGGCAFKNPEGCFAGKLIDEHGIKGMSVGDAEVSKIHGNFIVNRGHATATDVIELIRQIRATIYEKSGYVFEPEILLMGRSWDEVLGPIEKGAGNV